MTSHQNTEPSEAEAGEILEQIDADDQAQEPEEAPQEPQDGADQAETPEDTPGRSKAARDAAKYRTQVRELETERTQLTEQLENVQRQVIDAHIEKHGLTPALLWRTGLEAREVLDDDGRVNPDRVREACDTVRTEFNLNSTRLDPAQNADVDAPEDRAPQLFTPRR